MIVLTVEIGVNAESERDAEKKLDNWLRSQEDNDDLVYYQVQTSEVDK